MPDKNAESLGETLNKIIAETVESISEVVTDIVEGVEAILSAPEHATETVKPVQSTAATDLPIAETASQANDQNAENRVGYTSLELPQAEEPEAETAIETGDKTEVEAQIARARLTGEEAPAEKKDPLVADSLPALPVFDQVKLHLQSPNRVFAYWGIAGNPYETLRKALGRRADNYQLVTRLVNLGTSAESFAPAAQTGNWWYSVRSNSNYRVDIGFFAFNRPFIRLFSSNVVTTPRSAPSPRAATDSDWVISTREFVGVLTASGYSQDVFNVAFEINGDDGSNDDHTETSMETATLAAANRFAPLFNDELDLSELRWALVSLAAGIELADLHPYFSAALADWFDKTLQANESTLSAENVRLVLDSIFGGSFVELIVENSEIAVQRLTPIVGASAIHFPEVKFPKLRFSDLRSSDYKFGDSTLPEHLRFASHNL